MILIIITIAFLFIGCWILFRYPKAMGGEISNCTNCILLKKKLKQRTVFMLLLMTLLATCLTLFEFVPMLRDLDVLPGNRYQIVYSRSPNSYYVMDVYAIRKRDNQYEVHADIIVGDQYPITMKRPATLGTVRSFEEAAMTCSTIKWLNDRVVVTPGIKGNEYSISKSIYTKHR